MPVPIQDLTVPDETTAFLRGEVIICIKIVFGKTEFS